MVLENNCRNSSRVESIKITLIISNFGRNEKREHKKFQRRMKMKGSPPFFWLDDCLLPSLPTPPLKFQICLILDG
ncbi:hypothetical protein Leryth_005375 [Lithospermum erythrorhizon]|nr:hypothetical protein Leryth_005375 [Lithospermum erythrorhizon]